MGAACSELQATIELADGAVVIPGERARLHTERCPSCKALVAELGRSVVATGASGAELDEITRASMLRKMAPELDDLAATYARSGKRRWELRLRPATAALAVAAVALIAVGVYQFGRGRSRGADLPVALAPAAQTVALRPYVIAGEISRAPTAGSLLGGAVSHINVPYGTRMRARVPHGDIELVGPAELGITINDGGGYRLSLSGGTLFAEIDPPTSPSARPPIQVVTDSAEVTVVGTVFSVADQGPTTRVAVTRGTVTVTTGTGRAVPVAADEQWHAGETLAITSWQRRALEEHVGTRLARPASARLLELVDSSGVGVSVDGRKIGVTPLMAWIDSDVEVVLDGASREAPAAVVGADREVVPEVVVAPRTTTVASDGTGGTGGTESEAPDTSPTGWSAEERYDKAEAALRAGEADEAEAYWRDMVRRYPDHQLTDLALYDLAQLAARRDRHAQALGYVKSVLVRDRDAALREPASWLRCELLGELAPAAEARRCLEEFRASFPASVHEREARQLIEVDLGPTNSRARAGSSAPELETATQPPNSSKP